MATTDFDGKNLMLLGEGTQVALVMGNKSWRGTLQMRKDGIQESWYIKLDAVHDGEPDEIQIVKREGTVTITDEAPKAE